VLAMLALAFLTIQTATQTIDHHDLIPLTRNEIRHLTATIILAAAHDIGHRLRRSLWRRRHQQRARNSHYQRRSPST
jgi:hypothetical protein